MPVDKVVELFNIPDLRPALADFLSQWATPNYSPNAASIGGCCPARYDAYLPCTHLKVWYSFRIQK